jgi:hypothetical protein
VLVFSQDFAADHESGGQQTGELAKLWVPAAASLLRYNWLPYLSEKSVVVLRNSISHWVVALKIHYSISVEFFSRLCCWSRVRRSANWRASQVVSSIGEQPSGEPSSCSSRSVMNEPMSCLCVCFYVPCLCVLCVSSCYAYACYVCLFAVPLCLYVMPVRAYPTCVYVMRVRVCHACMCHECVSYLCMYMSCLCICVLLWFYKIYSYSNTTTVCLLINQK